MRRASPPRPLAAGAVALLLAVLVGFGPGAVRAQERPTDLAVTLSESAATVFTGDTFTFTSEIANHGGQATPVMIASLNFVAVDGQTYVDPEDWSPQRTVTIPAIAAHSSTTLTWTVNPVLAGDIAAYVVVVPKPPALAAAGALTASSAIHLLVDERRALNPGGVLPVVLAVPVVLALAFASVRLARRR